MGDWRWLAAEALTLAWAVPLVRIARAWRGTSLAPTAGWLLLTWFWHATLPLALFFGLVHELPTAYLMLLFAALPFVSALGARAPGVLYWNLFIVGGLAVVLGMPLIEQTAGSPAWRIDEPRALFLALILFVALLDYGPTRHGFAAILAVGAMACLLWGLHFGIEEKVRPRALLGVHVAVTAAAWLAWLRGRGPGPFQTPDVLWLAFRDRYGAVWALRVMEQTNQAMKHAGWNVRLTWFGFSPYEGAGALPKQNEVMAKLQAALQKFMPSEGSKGEPGA